MGANLMKAGLTSEGVYWKFMGQCTECGHCRETCSSLSCAGLNLGQIAKRMLAAKRVAQRAAAQAPLANKTPDEGIVAGKDLQGGVEVMPPKVSSSAETVPAVEAEAETTVLGAEAAASDALPDAAANAEAVPNASAQAVSDAAAIEAAYRTALAQAISADQNLVQAVRGCFFCTSCQQACFAHNDVTELIYAARVDFQNMGLIPRDAWSSVLVDQEWDIFTAYRAIWGIGYADLTRHLASDYDKAQTDCDLAFFPGCSLAAYGPELTREVFATLEELDGKATMIDHCCGSPLKSAGFYDRAEALCQRIAGEIEMSGAKTVVCACPGCKNALAEAVHRAGIEARTGRSVRVTTVSEFLLEHGFSPKRDCSQLAMCFSKSCQDRDGSCLQATRELLGATAEQTTVFHGCCGAGGAVSAYDYSRQGQQIDKKLSFAKDGEMVVTMCPTCTYTYAFQLMSAPRAIGNANYLELLFLNGFDWNKVSYQLNSMWTGQYGPWLASIF